MTGFKHGMHKIPEYRVWAQMVQRCTNPRNKKWHLYGGRGITVCARWRKFENFIGDMGTRAPGSTIERLDNDRGYEPGNCAWVGRKQNARNTRRNKMIEFRGETRSLAEWCDITGVRYGVAETRLRKNWPLEDVFSPLLFPRGSETMTASQRTAARLTYENNLKKGPDA